MGVIVMFSYQPKNPFYSLLMLLNRQDFIEVPLVDPYFQSSDPSKVLAEQHLDNSNGVFISEIKTKLYLHKEYPSWFGMTERGKIAIMIDIEKGSEINRKFTEQCIKHSIEITGEEKSGICENNKTNGDDIRNEIKSSDFNNSIEENSLDASALSASSPNNTKKKIKLSKQKEERIRKEYFEQMKHDTKKLIVKDFLQNSDISPLDYLQKIAPKAQRLDAFNLLLGDLTNGLYFFCNTDFEKVVYELLHGEYVVSPIPGLDTNTASYPFIDESKNVFLKTAYSLGSYDFEDIPVDPVAYLSWVSGKQELVRNRRKHVTSPEIISKLFNILENEEKKEVLASQDFSDYLSDLDPYLRNLMSSMFVTHKVYGTIVNMVICVQEKEEPSHDDCKKYFGEVKTEVKSPPPVSPQNQFSQVRRRRGSSFKREQPRLTSKNSPPLEVEKPPEPIEKQYICNLYTRRYYHDKIAKYREEDEEYKFWSNLMGNEIGLDDRFYKSTLRHFILRTIKQPEPKTTEPIVNRPRASSFRSPKG
ncbi:hypothetical protein ABK040_008145 [Willaertia magna]